MKITKFTGKIMEYDEFDPAACLESEIPAKEICPHCNKEFNGLEALVRFDDSREIVPVFCPHCREHLPLENTFVGILIKPGQPPELIEIDKFKASVLFDDILEEYHDVLLFKNISILYNTFKPGTKNFKFPNNEVFGPALAIKTNNTLDEFVSVNEKDFEEITTFVYCHR